MIPSQMLKGTLEGCVLAIISKKETYGYEISRQLEEYGFGNIAEGTVYPLLAVYRQSEVGPKRKYYSLTDAGREELKTFFKNYRELADAVQRLEADMEGMDDE